MRHRITSSFVILLATAALAGPVHAQMVGSVRHIPAAEGDSGQSLEVVATVSRGWESNLELRYRPPGAVTWQAVTFTRRDSTTYVATVPGEAMIPPGIEYFITTTGDSPQTRFATSETPHRVNVFRSAVQVRRKKHLDRHDNRRAQIRIGSEFVDYGSRQFGGVQVPDQYLRVDGEVGYRMLNFPLKTLSFGYTYLLGQTPLGARGDVGQCAPTPEDAAPCPAEVGFRTSGWFQLRFLLSDGVEADARGIVMATTTGFNVGFRGELRIGDAYGTHLGVGAEILPDIGSAGHIRLGWGTVPGFPMSATVEVTDLPAPARAAAVRLIYDISKPFKNGFRVGARVGYQARDQQVGGLSFGFNTSLDF